MKPGTLFVLNHDLLLTAPNVRGAWRAFTPGILAQIKKADTGLVKPALETSHVGENGASKQTATAAGSIPNAQEGSSVFNAGCRDGDSSEALATDKRWRMLWALVAILCVGAASYCGQGISNVRQMRDKHQLGLQIREKERLIQELRANQARQERAHAESMAAMQSRTTVQLAEWVKTHSSQAQARSLQQVAARTVGTPSPTVQRPVVPPTATAGRDGRFVAISRRSNNKI